MAEFIEKQALMDKMHDAYEARNPVQNATMDEATMIVFHQPPADVRPVVRGHWIGTHSGLWQCSNPKCKVAYKARLVYIKPNFCPNCGADMRGGDAE